MLDLVEKALRPTKLECVRLDGKMSQQQRSTALEAFRTDDSKSVFLISLRSGGVGLNLTTASHVVLLDPWWNPAGAYDDAAPLCPPWMPWMPWITAAVLTLAGTRRAARASPRCGPLQWRSRQ